MQRTQRRKALTSFNGVQEKDRGSNGKDGSMKMTKFKERLERSRDEDETAERLKDSGEGNRNTVIDSERETIGGRRETNTERMQPERNEQEDKISEK